MRARRHLGTIAAYAAAAAAAALPLVAGAELINGTLGADDYSWTGSNSIFGLFTGIVKLIITVATILAAMFFMYAGFLYLTSGGDTAKITKAHEIFKNVGWGFLLLLAAWLIVVAILQSLGAKSWLLGIFGESGS